MVLYLIYYSILPSKFTSSHYFLGLSLQDIITEVHHFVHQLDLPQKIRIHLLIKLGELEERLLKGTSEKIQLSSMIAAFQVTRDMVKEEADK